MDINGERNGFVWGVRITSAQKSSTDVSLLVSKITFAPLDAHSLIFASILRFVPVVFGAERALWLSLLPLALGTAAAATASSARAAGIACAALLTQAGFALMAKAKGFTKSALALAIELAPLWLLSALIALTA